MAGGKLSPEAKALFAARLAHSRRPEAKAETARQKAEVARSINEATLAKKAEEAKVINAKASAAARTNLPTRTSGLQGRGVGQTGHMGGHGVGGLEPGAGGLLREQTR